MLSLDQTLRRRVEFRAGRLSVAAASEAHKASAMNAGKRHIGRPRNGPWAHSFPPESQGFSDAPLEGGRVWSVFVRTARITEAHLICINQYQRFRRV